MGHHSRFLVLLLVSYLLVLPFVHGYGRVQIGYPAGYNRHPIADTSTTQEYARKMRISFEVADYAEPEPNINPKNGYIFSPPSPVPAPPPRR